MEASSKTSNINPEAVREAAKTAGPSTPVVVGPLPDLRSEILRILSEQMPQQIQMTAPPSSDTLEQLVRLMLAKQEKDVRKENDDDRRRAIAREDMLKVAKEQEQIIAIRQAQCGAEYGRPGSHTKENGRSAINGQVHNDGLYHPVCFRCFKEFTPQRPGHEQISTSVTA